MGLVVIYYSKDRSATFEHTFYLCYNSPVMVKEASQKKIDLSITPFRLTVVIGGLILMVLNELFQWDIPYLQAIFAVAVLLSIFLTQPKD